MLSKILERGLDFHPNKTAIYYRDQEYTYLDLENQVGELAWGLKYKINLKSDDVVAIQSANTIEFVITLFACWRIGVTVTPMNPALKSDEIKYQLEHSEAKVFIFQSYCAEKAREAVSQLHPAPVKVIFGDEVRGNEVLLNSLFEKGEYAPKEVDSETLALIIYTSGTTGKPKGVMLTHNNCLSMIEMICEQIKLNEHDRSYLILPLFHVNSIHFTLGAPLLKGASVILTNRFETKEFLRNVDLYKPTYTVAVPTVYKLLSDLPSELIESYNLRSLKYGFCGAAPLSISLYEKVEKKYTFKLIEGWGLSEGTTASTNNPLNGERKAGSIGIPLLGQQVKVVNENGEELKAGEKGELIIKGKNVMKGYLNDEEATINTLKNGWLFTGDIGYKDNKGYLFISGRKKELIIRGGINIYPKQIEDIIYELTAISEVAVIGVEDDKYGEEVVAIISIQEGYNVSGEEIIDYCKTKMANYKCPKQIKVVDDLPKNSVGKIDKIKLKHVYQSSAVEQ